MFTHFTPEGLSVMVDVGDSNRSLDARRPACGAVYVDAATLARIRAGGVRQVDSCLVAAGWPGSLVPSAPRIIPLCHPLGLVLSWST